MIASVRYANALRPCILQVWATVRMRAVATSPWALRLPKMILRNCTAMRKACSTQLLVGREGRLKRYAYDPLRNLIDITDALGRHTRLAYFENQALQSLT